MIDALYDSELAVDGTYTAPAPGSVAVPVRLMRRLLPSGTALGLSGATSSANGYDVRVSEVAAPEEEAVVAIGADQYVVKSFTPDEEHLVWLLDLDPA